jgi:hypothetical protein
VDDGRRIARGVPAQERQTYQRDSLIIPNCCLTESVRQDMSNAVDIFDASVEQGQYRQCG